MVAKPRPHLALKLCQDFAVNNTPDPGKFVDPDQMLKDLGIDGDPAADVHRAGIVSSVEKVNYSIDPSTIKSGPAVTVADCRDSIHDNAK